MSRVDRSVELYTNVFRLGDVINTGVNLMNQHFVEVVQM